MKQALTVLAIVSLVVVGIPSFLIKAQEMTDITYVKDTEVQEVPETKEDTEDRPAGVVAQKNDVIGEVLGADTEGSAVIDNDDADSDVRSSDHRNKSSANPEEVAEESDPSSGNTHNVANLGSVEPVTVEEPYTRIKVLTPNGGELMKMDGNIHVTWTGGRAESRITVSLFHQNPYDLVTNYGVPTLIKLGSTRNTGELDVAVPEGLKPGRYFVLVEEPRDEGHNPAQQVSWDYSNRPFTIATAISPYYPVDVNNDHKVDVEDIKLLVDTHGNCPVVTDVNYGSPVPINVCWTDMNADRLVDMDDVSMILDHWNP